MAEEWFLGALQLRVRVWTFVKATIYKLLWNTIKEHFGGTLGMHVSVCVCVFQSPVGQGPNS